MSGPAWSTINPGLVSLFTALALPDPNTPQTPAWLAEWRDRARKATPTGDNTIWIAVSLNFDHAVECGLELPLETLGLGNDAHVTARDLITGEIITWNGRHQRVRIDPAVPPCRIWRIES